MSTVPAEGQGDGVAGGASVVLYDSPGCWKCDDVRESLERLGVAYRAITVRGDPEARAALVAAMGEPPQVPMLVDGRRAVWDRRRILAYLDETYGAAVPAAGSGYADMPVFMGGTCALDDAGCALEG